MKPLTPTFTTLVAATLIAASSFALAQTATTDPVGFVTVGIAGASGANSTLSFKALGLVRPVDYQGSAETATAGTPTVIDNEAPSGYGITPSASVKYFVEIVSGSAAGTTYDINSVSGTTITLASNLATGVVAGDSFKVRKHWTIADVYGATNSAGLTSGDEASVSDQILLYSAGAYQSYYYQTAPGPAGGTGWRSPSDVFANAGGTVIYPDDGVVVRRITTGAVNVVIAGAVKTGQTSVPVTAGINVLGNVYAAAMTLSSSNLYNASTPSSSLVGGDEASTADQVLLWNGTGYTTYYYQIAPGPAGGTGWRNANDVFADAGGTALPSGSSIIVKRAQGGAFNWVAPQHPASL